MPDAKWWEEGPIFSAQDRGGRITAIGPGEQVRSFSGRMALLIAIAAVVWTGLVVLWMPRMLRYGRPAEMADMARTWWWTVLLLVAVAIMAAATIAVYSAARGLYRQVDIAAALAALPGSVGIIAGGLIDGLRVGSAPAEDGGADATIQLIFMGAAAAALVVLAGWLPFAIARAHRRSRLITRLRESGAQHDGEVRTAGKTNGTLLGMTQFRGVEIAYAQASRRVTVAMTTSSSRVPLPSFPVIVFVGERGEIHVEPDPGRPWIFDPDVAKYSNSADGGGG